MKFETEFKAPDLLTPKKSGQAKIDLYAWLAKEAGSTDGIEGKLQVVIENKIHAREHAEQTSTYYQWANHRDFETSLYVFLTADEEMEAQHPAFIQFTYQQLWDYVLRPVLRHPSLPDESRYLVEQYMLNLNRNAKGECMAQTNIELCKSIYTRFKPIFDQIYVAVGKDAPKSDESGRRLRRLTVSLGNLVDAGLLQAGQELRATSNRRARLVDTADGIQVQVLTGSQDIYPTLSKAAQAVTGNSVNGWEFWKIPGKGNSLIPLSEVRARYGQQEGEFPW